MTINGTFNINKIITQTYYVIIQIKCWYIHTTYNHLSFRQLYNLYLSKYNVILK